MSHQASRYAKNLVTARVSRSLPTMGIHLFWVDPATRENLTHGSSREAQEEELLARKKTPGVLLRL
jgi:hypothetical protein